MKICIVNEFFKPFVTGGVDIFLENLIDFLISKGFEIKLITSKIGSKKEYCREKNFEIYRFNSSPIRIGHYQQLPGLTLPFNFLNYNMMSKIKDVIKYVDCVHINNLYHLSFGPLMMTKKLNKPFFLDIHDYWPICFRKDLLYAGRHFCSHNNPINCYHCLSLSNPFFISSFIPLSFEFFLRNMLIKTENSIVHSRFVYEKIKEYTGMKSLIIPYPYNGSIRKKPKTIHDKINILFMGRLQVQKGAHLIPSIAEKLKENGIDYEIYVLGDGVLYKKLDYLIRKKKLNVKLFGFVTDAQMKNKFLEESDVLLFPSTWYEPFGIGVLEAMAFGIPVIGSNFGGLNGLINENKVGITTFPQTEKIVDALVRLRDNPIMYKNFSMNGIKNIKKYESKKVFNQYLNLFTNSI